MIPYGRQDIRQSDIDAVVEVLQSSHLTQGNTVPAFEQAVIQYIGASYGVAVNSATSALHLSCLALGLGQGDWLWTTPITFVASANCALYCGARVDFVDIDPVTYTLCPLALEAKLKKAAQQGTLPKIVVPVALCGQSCDMAAINRLSKQYGFAILEDASHAIGGGYQQRYIGGGEDADITVFSFHPVKIITTAEGGMAVTCHENLASTMRALSSHGVTRDPAQMTQQSEGDWYYQQTGLGYNYRLTDIQAALGCTQITRLAEYVQVRTERAQLYDAALANLPLILPKQRADTASSWHLYVIQVLESAPMDRAEIFAAMRAAGILVNVHYIPVHLQPYYSKMGFKMGDFPNAEAYYARAMSIPLFPTMEDEQQRTVIETLQQYLGKWRCPTVFKYPG